MSKKELLKDLKTNLENLKKAKNFEMLKKGLLDINKTLNDLYEINKGKIDKSNPKKGGMSYYQKELTNLQTLLNPNGEKVLRACWDLYKLSLKTGRWSSLSKLLKIMRESAEYALTLWTFCYAYKIITEDGKTNEYASEAIKYWEHNQKSLVKELCSGYTKSNIDEELPLGVGLEGFGAKVLNLVRKIGYGANNTDPRFSKSLGCKWFADAIKSGSAWINDARNTANFY